MAVEVVLGLADAAEDIRDKHLEAFLVEGLDRRVGVFKLIDTSLAQLSFLTEASFKEAGEMVSIDSSTCIIIGFDEVAEFLQNDESSKRLAVEDGKFQLVCGPRFADPLDNPFLGRVGEPESPFIAGRFWNS